MAHVEHSGSIDRDIDPETRHILRRCSQSSLHDDHPALQDLDPSTKFIFYTPHTITGLIIGTKLGLHGSYALRHRHSTEGSCASRRVCTRALQRRDTLIAGATYGTVTR